MPKAYSYIRFSTPEQARGDSLRRQLAEAEKWCAARGMSLEEPLRDLGVSAHKGAHAELGSALGDFLALVKEGKIDEGSYLIVESLDRLSRENVLDALPRFLDLLRAGIRIVTLTDGQEYSADTVRESWHQLIVSLAVMARAHDESRVKGIRVGEAWRKKREKARTGDHKLTKRAPEWLTLIDNQFHLREDRVELVRRIFRETIEGYGRRTIANRLNLEGVPAFKGKNGWHSSSIAKILNNRAVLGEYQPGTGTPSNRTHRPEGEPIRDYYPPIVNETDWLRAQQAADGRRIAGGRRGPGVAHLLTGLAKCARCGGPMHIVNKGKPPKGAIYFECSTARRKAGCPNVVRWRVDVIEQRLLRHLPYIDVDAVLCGGAAKKETDQVDILRARLSDAEKRRDKASELFMISAGRDEAIIERYGRLVDEAETIQAELKNAEQQAAKSAADPGFKDRIADAVNLAREMDQTEGHERTVIRMRLAEQLRKLVERVTFDNELSVMAVLRQRPDIPEEQIPWIWGSSERVPWLLYLDYDHDPHGPAPYEWDESPDPTPLPPGLRKLAEQGRRRRQRTP